MWHLPVLCLPSPRVEEQALNLTQVQEGIERFPSGSPPQPVLSGCLCWNISAANWESHFWECKGWLCNTNVHCSWRHPVPSMAFQASAKSTAGGKDAAALGKPRLPWREVLGISSAQGLPGLGQDGEDKRAAVGCGRPLATPLLGSRSFSYSDPEINSKGQCCLCPMWIQPDLGKIMIFCGTPGNEAATGKDLRTPCLESSLCSTDFYLSTSANSLS